MWWYIQLTDKLFFKLLQKGVYLTCHILVENIFDSQGL